MTRSVWTITALGVMLAANAASGEVPPNLFEYVKQPDPAFAWKALETRKSPDGVRHDIELVSQVWRKYAWRHVLRIYEPARVQHQQVALLFITGGRNDRPPKDSDDAQYLTLAKMAGARVAVLYYVPNQPLLADRFEDDLISETFVEYLKERAPEWPLLFPMVKSAVKAMDVVQAWSQANLPAKIEKFVVTGASKRGWTTWLTSAVDPRVVAFAPMVIDTLNMQVQTKRQMEIWGRYSEQIEDYTRRGLTESFDTQAGRWLWEAVDPYFYRQHLRQPKLIINGTNDRYWTLDALNVYWDALEGPKWVVYLPNAGHGLDQHREYAFQGIAAMVHQAAGAIALPTLAWEHSNGPDGPRLKIQSSVTPKSATLWTATALNRDFREAVWTSTPMTIEEGRVVGEAKRPEVGNFALFGILDYEINGVPFHLSTQVREFLPAQRK